MKKATIYYLLAGVALIIAIVVAVNANSTDTNNTNIATTEDSISITTVIQVDEEKDTFEQTVSASTTALDALQLLSDEGKITIETTDYDFGTLVDSINGTGGDATMNKYWIYYINDTAAEVGASAYVVQDGDEIRWNFEDAI